MLNCICTVRRDTSFLYDVCVVVLSAYFGIIPVGNQQKKEELFHSKAVLFTSVITEANLYILLLRNCSRTTVTRDVEQTS